MIWHPAAERRRPWAAAALSIGALLLAGCTAPDSERKAETASTDSLSATAPPPLQPAGSEAGPPGAGPATVGGDGSPIVLSPLSAPDLEGAKLPGELGCSFATAASAAAPLLVVMGNVASRDAAQGVVKVGDYVERVAAPGGFDGLPGGATFSGAGKTIRIDLTGPATGGGESPPRPATLTYDRADGARLTLAGLWTCGP